MRDTLHHIQICNRNSKILEEVDNISMLSEKLLVYLVTPQTQLTINNLVLEKLMNKLDDVKNAIFDLIDVVDSPYKH